jgi:hypothetical protein
MRAAALDRQIDFFHYDPADNSMRFATSIEPKGAAGSWRRCQGQPAVNGFRMAAEDRAQFQQLQSAQLRIDVVQTKSLMQNLLDPMAWTSLASLFPDSRQLPPMQNLSFDPGAASQKMKQVLLPGGSGQWAVNLSMAHKESSFRAASCRPSAATRASSRRSSACRRSAWRRCRDSASLYGAFEQRTTFLLNSFPQLAFATQQARQLAMTQQGLNFVSGDYILVPHMYTDQLTPAPGQAGVAPGISGAQGIADQLVHHRSGAGL